MARKIGKPFWAAALITTTFIIGLTYIKSPKNEEQITNEDTADAISLSAKADKDSQNIKKDPQNQSKNNSNLPSLVSSPNDNMEQDVARRVISKLLLELSPELMKQELINLGFTLNQDHLPAAPETAPYLTISGANPKIGVTSVRVQYIMQASKADFDKILFEFEPNKTSFSELQNSLEKKYHKPGVASGPNNEYLEWTIDGKTTWIKAALKDDESPTGKILLGLEYQSE